MAKKLRFALEMKNGVPVRNIEELRENFSLEKALEYISNGRMQTWLRDRYCHDIADNIEDLDTGDPEYNKKLCDILGVEFDESQLEDIEKAKESDRKRELLKQFTDNQEFLENAYFAAFEQDDIYDLLDEGADTIYLCGERFSIPLGVNGVTYIGVNNPVAVISSKTLVDWSDKDILINGIRFDEKYQALVDAANAAEAAKSQPHREYGDFVEPEFHNMLTNDQKISSKALYKKLSEQLNGVYYDANRDTQNLYKKLSEIMEGVHYDPDRF